MLLFSEMGNMKSSRFRKSSSLTAGKSAGIEQNGFRIVLNSEKPLRSALQNSRHMYKEMLKIQPYLPQNFTNAGGMHELISV